MPTHRDDSSQSTDPFSEVAEEGNPFTILRRFIDSEISSLVTAFGTLRPHFEKSFEQLEKDHQVSWQRLAKNYERATNPERTKIQARTGEEEDQERQRSPKARHVEVPASLDLSSNDNDMLAFPISSAFDRFPATFPPHRYLAWEPDFTSGTHRPTAQFFAFNLYSPHRLEHDDLMHQEGARWRLAFEDLLAAQEGAKELKKHDAPTPWKPITSWIEELQNRGLASRSIDPRDVLEDESSAEEAFNSSRKDSRAEVGQHRQDGDPQKSSMTELGLYEQFLGGNKITDRRQDGIESSKPTVTSTLTTTQRRRLPDGTVTTKTVLKKRFADGSEETEEKTDTTHASHMQQNSQRAEPVRRQADQAEHNGRDKSSWFWSS